MAESYEAYQMMYDSLAGWSASDISPTGQLATAVTPSADGKTWTCTNRSGDTWSARDDRPRGARPGTVHDHGGRAGRVFRY